MGRIVKDIYIDNKKKSTLFDTGAVTSYIKRSSLPKNIICISDRSITVKMGGKIQKTKDTCLLKGKIDGKTFTFRAYVIDSIGQVKDNGKSVIDLDILIGSTVMEEWDIGLSPKTQEIDLSGLDKREFISF